MTMKQWDGSALWDVLSRMADKVKGVPGVQDVFTPHALCSSMLTELKGCVSFADKEFLVFNLEFVASLVLDFGVKGDKIWFVADGDLKEKMVLRIAGCAGVHVEKVDIRLDGVEGMSPFGGKKFDVVIMNPPYQAPNNRKDSDKGKGARTTIWQDFVKKAFEVVKEGGHVCAIHPPRWRKPGDKTGKLLMGYDIPFLSMHNIEAGRKTFGCGTRYDWYVARKSSEGLITRVVCEDGKQEDLVLKGFPFIPNKDVKFILSLLAKEGEEKSEVLCSMGGGNVSIIPWLSSTKHDEFQHPYVHKTTKNGVELLYGSKRDIRMFGLSKVIFSDTGTNNPILDVNGEYGMTTNVIAIVVSSKEEAISIGNAIRSKKFRATFCESCVFSSYRVEHQVFRYLRKDFWKEFVDENGNEIP